MRKKEAKALFGGGLLFFWAVVFFAREVLAASSSRMALHSASGFLMAALDVLLVLGILFCLVSSLKVKSFLKYGELGYGWMIFSFAFAILFIAQLLSLSVSSGVLHVPPTIVSLTRLVSISCLAFGIYFIKRVLS